MSHHGAEEFRDDIAKRFGLDARLGATGRFPHGKLSEHDGGEIMIGIAADPQRRKVLFDFGKPIAALGCTPEQALQIADSLRAHAGKAIGVDFGEAPPSIDFVEQFICDLPWSEHSTDHEKTLVAGNIRNFANHLRKSNGQE